MSSLVKENIRIALGSIKSQKVRTSLTIAIIAFGIMALVGILTAIDAIKGAINSNFTRMGANTFTIRNKETNLRIGQGGKKPKKYRPITYAEASRFVDEFKFPSKASVSTFATFAGTVKFGSEKTNPNIQVLGGDINYIFTSGYELEKGRNFSQEEATSGRSVVILGKDVISTLFKKKENPLDKEVMINGNKYRVIGVLKSKGNSMGFGGDKICIIPLQNARVYFSDPNQSFTINVISTDGRQMETAISEATGLFRIIRKVRIGDDENFEITKSDKFATMLIDNMSFVSAAATLIGVITLVGAAIGLMNIMLVSISERTREIGTRKALGATKIMIRRQFLIEAIVICQLGGIIGIFLGIVAGNLISVLVGGAFIIPWFWIFIGVTICFITGLVSGIYPAIKASNLDPIEALRFE